MRIIGIIPARGGSEGIPGKNIKPLNGYPLIFYTIRQALESELLNRLIVSTDDSVIAECAKEYGAEVPFLRPASLANSTSTALEFILHAISEVEKSGESYDAVCLLQPTSPYRPKGVIDAAIRKYCSGNSKTLVSVRKVPTHYNPHWTFFDQNGLLVPSIPTALITRRQDLPQAYHRDGAIYLLNIEFLKREGRLLSEDLTWLEIDSPQLINIDSPQDWNIAEKYIWNQ